MKINIFYFLFLFFISIFLLSSCEVNEIKISPGESDEEYYLAFKENHPAELEALKLGLAEEFEKSVKKSFEAFEDDLNVDPISKYYNTLFVQYYHERNNRLSWLDGKRDTQTEAAYIRKDSLLKFFEHYNEADGMKIYFAKYPEMDPIPSNPNYKENSNTVVLKLTINEKDMSHDLDEYDNEGKLIKSVARNFAKLCPPCN